MTRTPPRLARLCLEQLVHVHSTPINTSAAASWKKEKRFYFKIREIHYYRFSFKSHHHILLIPVRALFWEKGCDDERLTKKIKKKKRSFLHLRARGGSTAAACTSFFFHKFRESHISTLLCKVSSSAQHFPPVPPAPMGHPRPPGADRSLYHSTCTRVNGHMWAPPLFHFVWDFSLVSHKPV